MKSLLFQLAYQAASAVLLLFYANKYQLGQKQHDRGRKQRFMKTVSASENNDRGRQAFGTGHSSNINFKATENEQCSP